MSREVVRPVCISCGDVLGDKEEMFKRLIKQGVQTGEAMDRLGISNMCCRTRFMSPGILPQGIQLQDTAAESRLEDRNIRRKYVASSTCALIAVEHHDGKDYIISVIPSLDLNTELIKEYKVRQSTKLRGDSALIGENVIEIETEGLDEIILDERYLPKALVTENLRKVPVLEGYLNSNLV